MLVDNERRFFRRSGHQFAFKEESVLARDREVAEFEREEAQNQRRSAVKHWLGRLDEREWRIIVSRYGLGCAPEQTLAQIGQVGDEQGTRPSDRGGRGGQTP